MRAAAARSLTLLAARELGARDALQHGALPHMLTLATAAATGADAGGADASCAGGGCGGGGSEGSPPGVRDEGLAALSALVAFEAGRRALAGHKGGLAALVAAAGCEEAGRAAAALGILLACTQVYTCGCSRAAGGGCWRR